MRARSRLSPPSTFFRRRLDAFDGFAGDDVGEVFVQRGQGGIRRRVFEPDDEQILDEAGGLEIPVKARDDFHRLVCVVGDAVQIQVVGRNQLVAEQVFADVFVPRFPIRAAGGSTSTSGMSWLLPVCMSVSAS